MTANDIRFEDHLLDVEEKLEGVRRAIADADLGIDADVVRLQRAYDKARRRVYRDLSPWQKVWIARHPQRPGGTDYVEALITDRVTLTADHIDGDDRALDTGLGWFEGRPVVYLAHRRGRNTRENLAMNFGMMHPQGYRKAHRIMQLAAKFNRPIISFIDTQAAHPGARAESSGQAMAIAENLYEMARLPVPVVVVVVGQGGSGGALGVGVGNVLLMLEYSVYCVAPPEACSGIIWKDSGEHAPEAAEGLKLTAADLLEYGVADVILGEPVGGAHRDPAEMFRRVRAELSKHVQELSRLSAEELVEHRYEKHRSIGFWLENTVV